MKRIFEVIFLLSFIGMGLFSCSNQTEENAEAENDVVLEIPMLTPVSGDEALFSPSEPTASVDFSTKENREAIIAYTLVQLQGNITNLQRDDQFQIHLDSNLSVTAVVRRNEEQVSGIQSLSANLQEPHTGNVTVTIRDGKMTGFMDVLSENRLFHIQYDERNSMHFLAEIDRNKLDIQEGSEPLEMDY